MRLLAISGSLRMGSSNTALLEAARLLVPADAAVELYSGLSTLPHFNPDVEMSALPPEVRDLRDRVTDADGLIFSTPEYAHGLPGSFKNLLDWLVGDERFAGKPVAVFSPSSRAVHAREQLELVLRTMSAWIVEDASVIVTLPTRETPSDVITADPMLADPLRSALRQFIAAIRHGPPRPRD